MGFASEIQAGAADYTVLCLAAKRAWIELMTIAAEFNTQVKVIESCVRQQFSPIYVTTGTTTDQELLDLMALLTAGFILSRMLSRKQGRWMLLFGSGSVLFTAGMIIWSIVTFGF